MYQSKKIKSAMIAVFIATNALLCGHAAAAPDLSPQTKQNNKISNAEHRVMFNDGAILSFNNLTIKDVYKDNQGSIIIKLDPSNPSLDDKKQKIISKHKFFYHNTNTGDNNFYQLEGRITTTDGNSSIPTDYTGDLHYVISSDLPSHTLQRTDGSDKWSDYLSKNKGNLVALPDRPLLKFALKDQENRLIIVTEDAFTYDYKLYVGQSGKMQECKILEANLLRDGGSLSVTGLNSSGKSLNVFFPSDYRKSSSGSRPIVNGMPAEDITNNFVSREARWDTGIPLLGNVETLKSPISYPNTPERNMTPLNNMYVP